MPDSSPILRQTACGKVTRLALSPAALSAESIATLRAELWKAWSGAENEHLVIDFSRIKFMPSLVLGVLLEFSQHVSSEGGAVRLAGMSPKIRSVFAVSELDRVLDIRNDPETAFDA